MDKHKKFINSKYILIFSMIFLIGIVSATNCYQESANVATACGGLSTGTYSIAGYDYAGNSMLTFDVTYTKPVGANISSVWTIKPNSGVRNVSLTAGCFAQQPLKLRLNISSTATSSLETYYCYDGSSWNQIQSVGSLTTSSRVVGDKLSAYDGNWATNVLYYSGVYYSASTGFYEEAMNWVIAPPVCNSDGDLNCDGKVTSQELVQYANTWINNPTQANRDLLGVAIVAWINTRNNP